MTVPEEAGSTGLVDLLVQASFEVVSVVTRVGAEQDLSLTLVRVLGILRDRTLTMAELAEYLGLERSTVSGLVDRAEKRGLVVRQAHSADGRSVVLSLSEVGGKLAEAGALEIARRIGPTLEGIPKREQEALAGVLTGLRRRK